MNFAAAAEHAIVGSTISEQAARAILGAAFDCDQRKSQVARDLREMSERFERLANTVEMSGHRIEVPINSLTDLSEASACYHQAARFLRLLITSHLGAEKAQDFEKALAR